MARVKAEWSGKYPCLCNGKWSLCVDGQWVSDRIPEELRDEPMDTHIVYFETSFFEDEPVDERCEDGLRCREWVAKNQYWLDNISADEEVQCEIFEAFQKADWRRHTCGGCH